MKAVWITDYDLHTDSCYKRPGCQECGVPVGKNGKCYSCGEELTLDEDQRHWIDENIKSETVEEVRWCFNCECETVHIVRKRFNPVSKEMNIGSGSCKRCGARFIV